MATVAHAARKYYRFMQRAVDPHKPRLPDLRSSGAPRRIHYLTPDYDRPAGGIRTIYRHVDLLNAAGMPATVMHMRRGFRCSWFEHDTVITNVRSTSVGPNDLLVVPEVLGALLPRIPPGMRHVVFNQSGHLTFAGDPAVVSAHHRMHPDLVGVMTVSEHSEMLVRHAFPDVNVVRVRLDVDARVFHPRERPPARQITYLTRRGRADAELALDILRSRGALDGWRVRAVDGVKPTELALLMRESMIFLSCPYQEGFGLPAAEAMSCGAYVVGYHGYGGREFLRPEFSSPVETGDALGLVHAIEQAIRREREEPGWCAEQGDRASKFVRSTYSAENERADVLGFYAIVLGD